MSGYVGLKRDEFGQWCADHRLDPGERAVLAHLLLEADWQSGIVEGFSLTRCSAELRLGRASGRRTLGERIARLEAAGAVRHTPAAGKRPGRVEILIFRQVVHLTAGIGRAIIARPTRGQTEVSARFSRAQMSLAARLSRDQSPQMPLPPADLSGEELATST